MPCYITKVYYTLRRLNMPSSLDVGVYSHKEFIQEPRPIQGNTVRVVQSIIVPKHSGEGYDVLLLEERKETERV